jgi:predicted transcriptional regulator of viral defense system
MERLVYYELMRDRQAPNEGRLYGMADEQLGYFTTEQASSCGYSRSMLAYHVARGRFLRAGWGTYRFSRYPYSPFEPMMVAWLQCGGDSVVSHESALALHGLSNVIPRGVHVTIERSRRSKRAPDGVILHTTSRSIAAEERVIHPESGVPITSVVRTLVDVAAADTPFEEIVNAVGEATALRPTLASSLRQAALERGGVAAERIGRALETVVINTPRMS